jgi:hypothetical protein
MKLHWQHWLRGWAARWCSAGSRKSRKRPWPRQRRPRRWKFSASRSSLITIRCWNAPPTPMQARGNCRAHRRSKLRPPSAQSRPPQARANEFGIPPGAASTLKVISPAEWVYFTVRNTSAKPIKVLHWEYAFLRLEQGQLATSAAVLSQTEIKPGTKKTFRQPLPTGATRCQVINARDTATPAKESKPYEYVCGHDFADPSLLREKPAPVRIRQIVYADGSNWSQP